MSIIIIIIIMDLYAMLYNAACYWESQNGKFENRIMNLCLIWLCIFIFIFETSFVVRNKKMRYLYYA